MATENRTTNPATQSPSTTSTTEDASKQTLPLPEPPSNTQAIELDASTGQGVKLDHLGPMVVNRDGSLSRIANWEQMTDIERRNTLRILGKRNQLRIETLQAEEDGKPATG